MQLLLLVMNSGGQDKSKYDLKERIFKFILDVLAYLESLPRTPVNKVIVGQCTRSATSIGANYEEADGAHTKKDFAYKMEVVRKEAKETNFWLRVSQHKNKNYQQVKSFALQQESFELVLIFSSIINKTKNA